MAERDLPPELARLRALDRQDHLRAAAKAGLTRAQARRHANADLRDGDREDAELHAPTDNLRHLRRVGRAMGESATKRAKLRGETGPKRERKAPAKPATRKSPTRTKTRKPPAGAVRGSPKRKGSRPG